MTRPVGTVVAEAMGAMPADWFDFVFTPDGGLRDIYIPQTTLEDWDRFLAHLSTTEYGVRVKANAAFTLATPAADIFEHVQSTDSIMLSIEFAPGAWANCHFFEETEIELDIDPRDITDAQTLQALLAFLCGLGRALARRVVLTFENDEDAPMLSFDAAMDKFEFPGPTLAARGEV